MRFGQSPLWKTSESGNGVFYHFSGTAVYRTKFDVTDDALRARVLSVGGRRGQVARVKLNGKDIGVVWCEPGEVRLPKGLLRACGNELEVHFTNVWANRLIGDECETPDCEFVKAPYPGGSYLKRFPDWFIKGERRHRLGEHVLRPGIISQLNHL